MSLQRIDPVEKIWLVKSSSRILGPYSLDEVTSMLLSNQISILDELRQIEGRWTYIRESQDLVEVVKKIRDQQDRNSENTTTVSVAQNTQTKSDSGAVSRLDEKTPGILKDFDSALPIENKFKDVASTAEKDLSNKASVSEALLKKNYGSAVDQQLQDRIRKQSNTLRWAIGVLVIVIIVGVVVMLNIRDRQKAQNYEFLLSQTVRYKSLGLYERAVEFYKKALVIKEPHQEIQFQMAPILISENRESLLGRRILEKSLTIEGRRRDELIDTYLGVAVSHMIDGNLAEAEGALQKAVGYDPTNESALLNLAILQMKKGQDAKAQKDFDAIYKKNPQSMIALYGYALSSIERAKFSANHSDLKPLIAELKIQIQKQSELQQQLALLVVYAENLIGDADAVNQAVVQFLSSEISVAEKFKHPLYVDWRFTQWEYLEKYCSDLFEKSNQTAEMKALRAVCQLEGKREGEAIATLKQALTEGPKDPYILGVQAGFLKKAGRIPESMSILKMSEMTSLRLKDHLLSEICISTHDVSCVQTAAATVYQQNRNDIVALYGLAWAAFKQQDKIKTREYLKLGLDISSNYLPMLELREQLESQ